MEVEEELFVAHDLGSPEFAIEGLKFDEFLLREIEAGPVDVFVAGYPSDRSFLAEGAAAGAVYDPFQYAHIFAKTGPEKLAVRAFTEPVTWKMRGVSLSLRCIVIQ